MPEQLDIAHLDHWLGFRPGMTRSEVEERLRQAGEDPRVHDDDNFSADVQDIYLEFWFETSGEKRLRQISTDSDIFWNGKPVTNVPLDDALRAFDLSERPPMWDTNDATDIPFPEPSTALARSASDESLLEEGTVWLPSHGLGLVIWRGEVMDLAWRGLRDLPAQFAGPVTDAQRQLSKRADLDEYLRSKNPATAPDVPVKGPVRVLQSLLIWICIGLLAFIARLGFQENRRWNAAPTLEGQFVSKEDVPRKKYFDLGPEAIRRYLPDDPRRYREMYHIEYLDPTGRAQQVALEAAEFYVPPREVGEKVQIAYLAGDPPRVKGLSRARDAAFIEYLPWAMLVGLFYVVAQFALGVVPRTWRSVVEILFASNNRRDTDRPELR